MRCFYYNKGDNRPKMIVLGAVNYVLDTMSSFCLSVQSKEYNKPAKDDCRVRSDSTTV